MMEMHQWTCSNCFADGDEDIPGFKMTYTTLCGLEKDLTQWFAIFVALWVFAIIKIFIPCYI